jgi:hypothetical protein
VLPEVEVVNERDKEATEKKSNLTNRDGGSRVFALSENILNMRDGWMERRMDGREDKNGGWCEVRLRRS